MTIYYAGGVLCDTESKLPVKPKCKLVSHWWDSYYKCACGWVLSGYVRRTTLREVVKKLVNDHLAKENHGN